MPAGIVAHRQPPAVRQDDRHRGAALLTSIPITRSIPCPHLVCGLAPTNRSGSEEQRGGITLRNGLQVPGFVPTSDPARPPRARGGRPTSMPQPRKTGFVWQFRAAAASAIPSRDGSGSFGFAHRSGRARLFPAVDSTAPGFVWTRRRAGLVRDPRATGARSGFAPRGFVRVGCAERPWPVRPSAVERTRAPARGRSLLIAAESWLGAWRKHLAAARPTQR